MNDARKSLAGRLFDAADAAAKEHISEFDSEFDLSGKDAAIANLALNKAALTDAAELATAAFILAAPGYDPSLPADGYDEDGLVVKFATLFCDGVLANLAMLTTATAERDQAAAKAMS